MQPPYQQWLPLLGWYPFVFMEIVLLVPLALLLVEHVEILVHRPSHVETSIMKLLLIL
jgi:hypothetical protein